MNNEPGFQRNTERKTAFSAHPGPKGGSAYPLNKTLNSASKKTTKFSVFDKKAPNTRLSKVLKPRSLQVINDCFKNESNAVVGVFFQRLNTKF
jgi:hypothetical protein